MADAWAYLSAAEITSIGKGFCSGTLPAADYHHREHLIATVYLLLTQPDRDWEAELPGMIRRYNEAQGGVNSDVAGYHHTITMFYLDRIRRLLADHRPLGLAEACAKLLASPIADKDYILRSYSRERLKTVEARKSFVLPDLPS